jgi:hypothetical protein
MYIAIAMPYKSYLLSIEQTHDGKFNKFSHELHDIVIRHKYCAILDTFLITCGWRDITETCRQKGVEKFIDYLEWCRFMDNGLVVQHFRNSIFDAWAVSSVFMNSTDSFRVDRLCQASIMIVGFKLLRHAALWCFHLALFPSGTEAIPKSNLLGVLWSNNTK